MRPVIAVIAALLLIPAIALPLGTASGAPEPVSCTGYPEPRVYSRESSRGCGPAGPPPAPADAIPARGKLGHIHTGDRASRKVRKRITHAVTMRRSACSGRGCSTGCGNGS